MVLVNYDQDYIYEREEIAIGPSACLQPALMRTCRQMREDSSLIFYHENDFRFDIVDLKFAPQSSHWIWTKVHPEKITLELESRHSWVNFVVWLERYSSGEIPGIKYAWSSYMAPVSRVFDIVEDLSNEPWRTVEIALVAYRRGVIAASSGSFSFTH